MRTQKEIDKIIKQRKKKQKQQAKAYYQKNKEKACEYGKNYRAENKEKLKKYYEENRESIKDKKRKSMQELRRYQRPFILLQIGAILPENIDENTMFSQSDWRYMRDMASWLSYILYRVKTKKY